MGKVVSGPRRRGTIGTALAEYVVGSATVGLQCPIPDDLILWTFDWPSRADVRGVYTDTRLTSSPPDAPAFSVSKARGNNLVALGSAAVLIVYTAGFAKTKPAADRMAAESAERRPRSASRAGAGAAGARSAAGESGDATVPAMPAVAVVNAPSAGAPIANAMGTVATSAGGVPAPSTEAVAPAAATVSKPAGSTPAVSIATVQTAPPVVTAPVAAPVTPPVVAPPVAAPSAPPPVQTAPVPVSTPAPVATPAAAPAAPAAAAPPAAPATAPAAKPAAKTTYKDGVFLGRGTSRHGDIEAMVEIQGGRITNAVISQCLTRYSCSWIAVLVPQVVARQSAEVDYVSGATVSSDAFYYAVTQALAQAK